ncbi:MAG: 50S ribosomal protein L18 [Alphaproteobacteria bacterium]
MIRKTERAARRKLRVHHKGKKLAIKIQAPRLVVFRSNFHIYAQLIDDARGFTLCSASSLDNDVRVKLKKGWNIEAAETVGQALAEKAAKSGVKKVVFDRGAYLYHGRIKALAMGARAGGLEF